MKVAKEITVARITARPVIIAAVVGLISTLGASLIGRIEWRPAPRESIAIERGYCTAHGNDVIAALDEKLIAVNQAKTKAIHDQRLELLVPLDAIGNDVHDTRQTAVDLTTRLDQAIVEDNTREKNSLRTRLNNLTYGFNFRLAAYLPSSLNLDLTNPNRRAGPIDFGEQPSVQTTDREPRNRSIQPRPVRPTPPTYSLPFALSIPIPMFGTNKESQTAVAQTEIPNSGTVRRVADHGSDVEYIWDSGCASGDSGCGNSTDSFAAQRQKIVSGLIARHSVPLRGLIKSPNPTVPSLRQPAMAPEEPLAPVENQQGGRRIIFSF
jgi:hypothetical protein